MDTARFKYPPFWVELDRLYESLDSIDMENGKKRGFVVLSKKKKVDQEGLKMINEFGDKEIGISLKDLVPKLDEIDFN